MNELRRHSIGDMEYKLFLLTAETAGTRREHSTLKHFFLFYKAVREYILCR